MVYIISKTTFGDYAVRDIQRNANWDCCPFSEYALIPDEMVPDIVETCGYCDITLNEEGTMVVSFTAREKPEIPVPTPPVNGIIASALANTDQADSAYAGKPVTVCFKTGANTSLSDNSQLAIWTIKNSALELRPVSLEEIRDLYLGYHYSKGVCREIDSGDIDTDSFRCLRYNAKFYTLRVSVDEYTTHITIEHEFLIQADKETGTPAITTLYYPVYQNAYAEIRVTVTFIDGIENIVFSITSDGGKILGVNGYY